MDMHMCQLKALALNFEPNCKNLLHILPAYKDMSIQDTYFYFLMLTPFSMSSDTYKCIVIKVLQVTKTLHLFHNKSKW